jgi:putative hydrolase of the HAD superfamily
VKPKTTGIGCLLLDVGGVLLSDGWSHGARQAAAARFKLNLEEMEARHRQTYDTYELGKLTLAEYLDQTVFYRPRPFTRAAFRRFLLAQSKPFPETIELIRQLKRKYPLKIIAVNNEGRELNRHRIQTFQLDRFVDAFVSSCFVHLRKPDADIYRLALDVAQVPARRAVYLEDRPLFVQIAQTLGIRALQHINLESTRAALAKLGLQVP